MFDVKTKRDADGTTADFHSGFDFFFEVCEWLTYSRDLKYTGHFSGPNRLRVEN